MISAEELDSLSLDVNDELVLCFFKQTRKPDSGGSACVSVLLATEQARGRSLSRRIQGTGGGAGERKHQYCIYTQTPDRPCVRH